MNRINVEIQLDEVSTITLSLHQSFRKICPKKQLLKSGQVAFSLYRTLTRSLSAEKASIDTSFIAGLGIATVKR